MIKTTLITLLFTILGLNIAEAPEPQFYYLQGRTTAAGLGSKVNYQGRSLRKELGRNPICAVSQNLNELLQDTVYIDGLGWMKVFDKVPNTSTNKHLRRADKRGVAIDGVFDIYYDCPKRELRYKDGIDGDYSEVKVPIHNPK